MHGGYECNDEGFWSDKCVPSYCDNGYYFDEIKVECIKDICIDDKKKNSKIYFIFSVIFGGLFTMFLSMFIFLTIVGGFKKKNYLLIPIALFLILSAVFIILDLTK
jgi:hypothetical protein